jgi:membrane-associated protease RseP (regulator of RpoE activity)
MTTFLVFILTISIVVGIHEFGHFQMARWCNVKVLKFSIGFGKPLFTFRLGKDHTEFVMSSIPLGGFVKLLDENNIEANERIKKIDLKRAFNRQSLIKRFLIISAGPLINIILGVLIFCFIYMSADMNNTDNIQIFFEDCKPNSVELLPPDINHSGFEFIPTNTTQILYGLGAIKGTGLAAIELILESRETKGPFKNLFDFCARLDLRKVNRRVVESLIRGGAFDTIEPNRASLLASVNLAITAAEQGKANIAQNSLFLSLIHI